MNRVTSADVRPFTQFGHRLALAALIGIAAVLVSVFAFAQRADAAQTADIINDASGSGSWAWLEGNAATWHNSGGRTFTITMVVKHPPGAIVDRLRIDQDWDGTNEGATVGTTNVAGSVQQAPGGSFNYSRVSHTFTASTDPGGWGCNIITGNGTRRRDDLPINVQAVLSNGDTSEVVSATVDWIQGDATGCEDYPFLFSLSGGGSVTPGSTVGFSYKGDDSDSNGCDEFRGINWRVRNVMTNGVVQTGSNSSGSNVENQQRNFNVTFPDRGRFVVEGEGLSECANHHTGRWYRIGSVDVNSANTDAPTLTGVPSRPTTNQTFTATAGVTDPDSGDGGRGQVIEWDAANDGTFERRDLADPESSGLTTAQRQLSVDTTGKTPGNYTIAVRTRDNGAMNAADTISRVSSVTTASYTVNSLPVVNNQTVTTDAAAGVEVNLGATDANGDSLTYSIQSGPSNGTISGGTTDDPTYTPNAGFAGTDQFTVHVSDGFGGTDTAVITVNVRPDTQIDSSPASGTDDTTPTFTFSSPQAASGGITFECRLDTSSTNPAFTACTSGSPVTAPGPGSYKFQVRAVKGALVDPTPAETPTPANEFFVIAPDTSVQSGPAAYTGTNPAGFLFGSNGTSVTFECKLDAGSYQPCGVSTDISVTQGSHTVLVRATDQAGVTDPTPASYTWFYDPFRPETFIGAHPLGTTNINDASFTFIGVDKVDEGTGVPGSGVVSYKCVLSGPINDPTDPCAPPMNYDDLPDGTYVFSVAARDEVGLGPPVEYEWTIDTAKPTATSIFDGPDEFTKDTTPNFQWTYSGLDLVAFECRIDGAATWTPCASGYGPPSPITTEVQHTFEVRAFDAAGNREATPAVHTWTVDTTNPEYVPQSQPPLESTSRDATFEFTSNEPDDAKFTCQLDNGTVDTDCTSPKTYTNLSDGPHTFEGMTIDRAGNESDEYSYTWNIDATPPAGTTIDDEPDNPDNSSTATFEFSNPTEDVVGFECRIDPTSPGDPWTGCTSPQAYPGLSDGAHTFEVRAIDDFGNREETPQTYTWAIDTDPPSTDFTTEPPDFTNAATVDFALTSDESPVTYECKLPGNSDFTNCSSTFSQSLAEGDYTIEARAIDAAGNKDLTPAVSQFTIDRTNPDTTIDTGPEGFVSSSSATFTFSSGEPGTFECRLDSTSPAAWNPCTSGDVISPLADGQHTFEVRAIDRAENIDTEPASRTWTVDTAAPNATIVDKPASLSNTRSPQFTFTSNEDPNVTYTCTLDGNDEPCTTPKTYAGVADGSHEFKVKATDQAGNTGTQDSYTWDLDATPPTGTTIDSGPTGTIGIPTAILTFSNAEAGVTLACSLDGAAFAPCAITQSLVSLSEGQHTFRVRATDPAGNDEVTPASRTWTVDMTGPDTNLTDGPTGTVAPNSAKFGFNASEGNVTYQCAIDGGQWESCDPGKEYTGLAPGEHTFRVRARDAVGNVDPTPAQRTWTVAQPIAPRQTIPEKPVVDPCTFRGLAPGCEDTRAGAKLTVSSKGGDSTASTASSPELATAVLTLRSGAKIKVTRALGGKQVGTFSLADRRGSAVKTGKLTLPKKPKTGGANTLFPKTNGLTVTLRGQTVALTGLPKGVHRVAITLNGKTTGILVASNPCTSLTWRAVLTDVLGGKQTTDAKGTCPPTTGAKR